MTATEQAEPRPIADKLDAVGRLIAARPPRGIGPAIDDEDMDLARAIARDARPATRWVELIPSRFAWAKLDDFDGHHGEELAAWSAAPAGRNLVLAGPVGVGKSHAAIAAVRADHFERGLDVVFLPIVELLDLLRPGGPPDSLSWLCEVDRLIIDDLGSERPTDWTAERLYAVINRRWLEERSTIVTTNVDVRSDLEAAVTPRLYSRLIGSGAVTLVLSGSDRRRAQP